ncbi:MAG: pseudouridine synthase [Panacagrimonas sp.]
MRLNKFISETGACSRRVADQWIEAGRVSVNGQRAALGTQVGVGDDVRVDGRPLGAKRGPVYIALNKPVGITCTTERHIEGNIVDFVGHAERIFPVGRLDKDSEGLILLTNQGDIVNEILREENGHEKEYVVTLDRPFAADFLSAMSAGVWLPELEVKTRPCRMVATGARTFRIVLTQGYNRQIRRMCEVFGYDVRRLQRVRIVNIALGALKVGKWRDLTESELRGLLPDRFADKPDSAS